MKKLSIDNLQFKFITSDHRKVTKESVFVAIKGSKADGHNFINEALNKGAIAVVFDKNHEHANEYIKLENTYATNNTRQTLATLACRLYNNPSTDLTLCGVTGTNGKTTTTYLLESIFNEAKMNPAVIGTIGYRFKNSTTKTEHTTPDSVEVQKCFSEFKKAGAESIVMEVSSHAIDQYRIYGSNFRAGIFTNLTQDHLDYHGTMENYFQTKVRFFTEYNLEIAAINSDDPYGLRCIELCKIKSPKTKIVSFGTKNAFINCKNLQYDINGIHGYLIAGNEQGEEQIEIHSSLVGKFNGMNISGAAAAAIGLGISKEYISLGIKNASQVPGRLEKIENESGIHVFVDYAHTPDALEKVLETLNSIKKEKLITVFGCGGDRDSGKRPLMGAIAERNSDQIIITSDNPRTEDPFKIIQQITMGLVTNKKPIIEIDREKAIQSAIQNSKKGDVILIAGKGHEDYQIIGTTKLPFDDRTIAKKWLSR